MDDKTINWLILDLKVVQNYVILFLTIRGSKIEI